MTRLIISIVFFLVLAVFIALNAPFTTSVNLFGYRMDEVSIVAVIIVTMAVGVLYSFTLYFSNYLAKSRTERLKRKKEKNKLRAEELKTQETELKKHTVVQPEPEQLSPPVDTSKPVEKKPSIKLLKRKRKSTPPGK